MPTTQSNLGIKAGDFEVRADELYRTSADIARCYYYSFTRPSVTCGGTPNVIFLGNHSAGKSTLINWILGGEKVEDVGLAPTDDAFTVIRYGETEEEALGPAALSRLPEEFKRLELFGSAFLDHLHVKIRRREILRNVTLIDSPGMIDAAEGTVDRTYDFPGVVQQFTDLCDIVFFLLDPDKPGTTGETVNVFAKCLRDISFKLRVLLNKCDSFTGMYDFARTYGTVCWNLARVLHTKDLPKILTIYSGEERTGANPTFDFSDFNRHRRDFLGLIANAAARRRDNVFSQVLTDFLGLSTRMCVLNHVARRLMRFTALSCVAAALVTATCAFMTYFLMTYRFSCRSFLAWGVAILAGGVVGFLAYWCHRITRRLFRIALARRVDAIFASEFQQKIVAGTHDNVNQPWLAIREETADIVREAPLRLPFFGEWKRRKTERAAAAVLKAFHAAAGS